MSTEAERIVEQYEALVLRGLEIVAGAPYWGGHLSQEERETANIAVEGSEATLTWFEATTEWESPILERKAATFDVSLLFASAEELAAWKAKQEAIYEEERKREHEHARRWKEIEERRQLAELQAKYGAMMQPGSGG